MTCRQVEQRNRNKAAPSGRRGAVAMGGKWLGVTHKETNNTDLQNPVPNATSTNSSNDLVLEVEGVAGDIRYLPIATFDLLGRGLY